MCWCDRASRTPICVGCPSDKRAEWPVSCGGLIPDELSRPAVRFDSSDACPIPPRAPIFVEIGHE